MNIKKDFRNELFRRQELSLEAESDKNLSYDEVRKKISEKFGKPEENIDVLKVDGSFGKNIFSIDAYIYDFKEDLNKLGELRKTQKQKKKYKEEAIKLREEKAGSEQDSESTKNSVKDETPIEDREPEQKPEIKPVEAPLEERAEEEKKEVEEREIAKEESKEN